MKIFAKIVAWVVIPLGVAYALFVISPQQLSLAPADDPWEYKLLVLGWITVWSGALGQMAIEGWSTKGSLIDTRPFYPPFHPIWAINAALAMFMGVGYMSYMVYSFFNYFPNWEPWRIPITAVMALVIGGIFLRGYVSWLQWYKSFAAPPTQG